MNEQIKYYFIVNKWAGAHHSAQTWEQLHQLLVQNAVNFERVVTKYPQHATQLAQEFADLHPQGWVIVAIGGDGTLLEVLNGVRRSKNTVPIGYERVRGMILHGQSASPLIHPRPYSN